MKRPGGQGRRRTSYLTGTLATKVLEDFSEEFGEELIGQLTDELMPEFKAMVEAKYTVVEAAHQSRKPQAGMKA
jgi:hypothetical protein